MTKLLLDHMGISNTPWISFHKSQDLNQTKLENFFKKHNSDVFIKAASQGSSVGCYHVTKETDLKVHINNAFKYSDHVLIEKSIKGRELEVSVFEFDGVVHASLPGEIKCEGDFYDYEEKYSNESTTQTDVIATDVANEISDKIKEISINVFKFFGLRHLSRVDFFLVDQTIYLNEINTFPGMTPISMFPKMLEKTLENKNKNFRDFLKDNIEQSLKKEGKNE